MEVIGIVVAIIVPFGTALIAWGSLRQRVISHEELDRTRFESIERMLKEVRDDVKQLIRGEF
jgi:hypothetical protein